MIRRIVLHGNMASFTNEPILIEGDTAAELVEAVTRQLPGFRPHPIKGRQRIKVVGYETQESLYEDLGDVEVIHIVPQFTGGKESGIIQILIGVALVAVGWMMPASYGWLGSLLMKVGAIAALGGLAAMLAPTPSDSEDRKSNYLGAPKNTTQIGTRIPVLYGTYPIYGQVLSFDINANEFKYDKEDD